jgi:hypothetical protein
MMAVGDNECQPTARPDASDITASARLVAAVDDFDGLASLHGGTRWRKAASPLLKLQRAGRGD